MSFWPKGYRHNKTSAEIEQHARERDARLEDFADRAAAGARAHGLVNKMYEGLAEDIADSMTISESMKVLSKVGLSRAFESYTRRERLEAWIKDKKIRMTYTAHSHEMAVQLWHTDIVFKEGFEHFPSEYMLAQIALAIEAGVVK